ncbi:hypothetical protein HQ531_06090 [bacterium]|nr:hypothetical protein [bacterium]
MISNNDKPGVPRNEVLQTNEYIAHVQSLGFANPSRMKFLFQENALPSAQDPAMRIAMLVGHAKLASLEGKFIEAKQQYDKALKYSGLKYLPKLKVKERNNLVAYIHYEYADFCNLVHSHELALSHYHQALGLTTNPRIKLIIQYQFALKELMEGITSDFTIFVQFIEKFKNNNMKVMEGIATLRFGAYFLSKADLKRAKEEFAKATKIAGNYDLKYLQWNVINYIGLLLHKEGKQKEAIEHYSRELETMESPYFKALMLKNQGTQYYLLNKPKKMLEVYINALEHCQIHGISSQISILAEAIGDLHLEINNSISHAYQYYQIAFNEVISLANSGIPITGKRLRVLEKYNKLIQENLPEDFMALKEPGMFEWSKGKTWIQIKDLFHYNLFVYHFLHTGIGSVTFSHLKIHPGTFYSLSKRMRDLRGITIPDLKGVDFDLPPSLFLDPLQKYSQLHRDKTWDQVNEQFEKDIYDYLFKESGYNKVKLAKMLDRSYAMILKQTKHLTDVDEDQRTQATA